MEPIVLQIPDSLKSIVAPLESVIRILSEQIAASSGASPGGSPRPAATTSAERSGPASSSVRRSACGRSGVLATLGTTEYGCRKYEPGGAATMAGKTRTKTAAPTDGAWVEAVAGGSRLTPPADALEGPGMPGVSPRHGPPTGTITLYRAIAVV